MTDTDILVIGGGATGLALAWDLSLRGLTVTLVEAGDFCSATSGRYHGLLHSGARYVVSDPGTARECIEENAILRRIVPRSIDDTGGMFVLGPDDDPSFVEPWLEGCRVAGITARELTSAQARVLEPLLGPALRRAFQVPDGVCHSMVLADCFQQAARARAAQLLAFHRVDGLLVEGGRVAGAAVTDLRAGSALRVRARLVVNAAGPWAGEVAAMAGIGLRLDLARGAMLAFRGRLVSSAIQRLRPPGDADAILPRGKVAIAGTTEVMTGDPGDRSLEPWETAALVEGLAGILPGLREAPVAHAWSAVRPLFDPRGRSAGRDARGFSRGFTVMDHAESHSVEGLVSVIGGKLATCRLMAEKTVDLACAKLGVRAPCRTADTVLA
jgi:glycerol-3-phosphate dehydrogenase